MRNILEIASELAHRMEVQRKKWFDACIELITYLNKEQSKIANPSLKGITEFIIKSFQLVHILSFIHMQRYTEDIGEFTKLLCEQVCGVQYENCVPYIDRYTKLKQEYRGEKFKEQFLIFAEDIALSITGSPAGMLLSPAVNATIFDFYTRNLILAAHAFEDNETANKLLSGIKKLHRVE